MKKLFMLVAVFAFALTVNYAFAYGSHHRDRGGEVNIESENEADIDNNIDVTAKTGDNEAEGQNARIRTGDAYADSVADTTANSNVTRVGCSRCLSGVKEVSIESENEADVDNNIDVTADTGDNEAEVKEEKRHHGGPATLHSIGGGSHRGGSASIRTGNATAYGDAITLVNSNVTEFGL